MTLMDFSKEAKRRILRFLEQYENIDYGSPDYSDDQAIMEGIRMLLETGFFCPMELQRHAAAEADVLIPPWLINLCRGGNDGG